MNKPFYSEAQNALTNINLLKASSVAYKIAKRNEYLFTYLFILLSISYPLMYTFWNFEGLKYLLFSVSLASTLFYQLLFNFIKGNTSKGAILKEQFDSVVLQIPWKFMLTRIDDGEIIKLANLYRGKPIVDWYPISISSQFLRNTAIAICQRTNSAWDKELRIIYNNLLKTCTILHFLLLVIFFFLTSPGSDIVFLTCFSIAPAYTHFITLIRGNSLAIERRRLILEKLDYLIDTPIAIRDEIIRDIQDEIFSVRSESVKIPDRFFNRHNEELQAQILQYVDKKNSDNILGFKL